MGFADGSYLELIAFIRPKPDHRWGGWAARGHQGFIDYAYARNGGDPHWIPPLRIAEAARLTPTKNPFFQHADVEPLLAWRRDRLVGRVAAIDDRLHNETHGDNAAMFGFFEAEDGDALRAGEVESTRDAKGRVERPRARRAGGTRLTF